MEHSMNPNKTVVDLNKVQFARFGYRNQHGDYRHTKPKFSVNNTEFSVDEPALSTVPETMLEQAYRRGIVDAWYPVLKLQLTANHSLTYTGEKAKALWKEWNRRQFAGKDICAHTV